MRGFEEVRVQGERGGGGAGEKDLLPGGKKSLHTPFVSSTIGTVSWATGEPSTGGEGRRQKRRAVRGGLGEIE